MLQALQDLQQQIGALQVGQRNDPSSLTPVGPYGHGSGGLFSQAGADPSVFSAIIAPPPGLISEIPVYNGLDDSPGGQFGAVDQEYFSSITGVTQGALETFANQPTTQCADGARAGIMKICTLVSGFGRYRFSPNAPVNIFDAGRRRDIADPLTLRLMNQSQMQSFGVPSMARSAENALLNELARRMYEMGLSTSRFMARRVFAGSPANNNGEARDITGLDIWINENNKRDAYTTNLCTALNSDVKNFGHSLVTGNTRDIQEYAEMMVAYLDFNTRHQGMGENWDGWIVMRPEAWEVISTVVNVRQYQEVIAQANAVNQHRLSGGARDAANVMIDARAALDQRNGMRSGLYWPLRGRNIPVVLDLGITEQNVTNQAALAAGQYASTIYFVPRSVLGGIPVTYWKYYDHQNGNSESLARIAGNSGTFTSDNGMFRWYVNFKNGCLDLTVDFSPRLICRATQLAGRIDNVAYQPLQHFRDMDPASSYFADGGRTNSPTQTFYTQWSSTPVSI